jgi:Delta7-sterol 5-desaturase
LQPSPSQFHFQELIGWIATPETAFTILVPSSNKDDDDEDGATTTTTSSMTYPSIYHAILNNDPLSHPCRNFNAYINSWIISPQMANTLAHWLMKMKASSSSSSSTSKSIPVMTRRGLEWTHYLLCYIRNFMGAMMVYYGTASLFSYFIYLHPPTTQRLFQHRTRPTASIMWNQIQLSQMSMMIYTLLPVIDEWLVEQGYTKMYYTVAEVGGWWNHIGHMAVYLLAVELGVYWMHRTLHTNKFLYKHVHLMHHQYKTADTLTPWASIAFHPLDGMLQASPYVTLLPLLPCHYTCHVGCLFFTAIWATFIHDAMDYNVIENSKDYPMLAIMGSKYHTIHHTHYMYNHGQFTTFFDWMFGTLKVPTAPTGVVVGGGGGVNPKMTTKKME